MRFSSGIPRILNRRARRDHRRERHDHRREPVVQTGEAANLARECDPGDRRSHSRARRAALRPRPTHALTCMAPLLPPPPPALPADPPDLTLPLHVSWGHRSGARSPFRIEFAGEDLAIKDVRPAGLEPADGLREGAWRTTAGGGDVDGVDLTLVCPRREVK